MLSCQPKTEHFDIVAVNTHIFRVRVTQMCIFVVGSSPLTRVIALNEQCKPSLMICYDLRRVCSKLALASNTETQINHDNSYLIDVLSYSLAKSIEIHFDSFD